MKVRRVLALIGWLTLSATASPLAQVQANSSQASLSVDGRARDGFLGSAAYEWIPGGTLSVELGGLPGQPVSLLLGEALAPGLSFGGTGILNLRSPVAVLNGFEPGGFLFQTGPDGVFTIGLGSYVPLGMEFSLQGIVGSPSGASLTAPERIRSVPARIFLWSGNGMTGTTPFGGPPVSLSPPSIGVSKFLGEVAIAPDGLRVAYVSYGSGSGIDELHLIDAVGDGVNRPVEVVRSTNPLAPGIRDLAWAPGGDRLAFVLADGSEALLHIVDRDGSNLTVVEDIDVGEIAWSPDGSSLAFATALFSSFSAPEAFLVSADGGSLVSLSAGLSHSGTGPPVFQWAPDGSLIAVGVAQAQAEVFALLPDASSSTPLFSGTYEFQWAPNGERIAFRVAEGVGGTAPRSLWSVRADGTGTVQLSRAGAPHAVRVFDYAWSDDGSHLAYISNDLGGPNRLFVVSADGVSSPRRHVSGFVAATARVGSFQWAPGGDWLAFDVEPSNLLYSVDRQTGVGYLQTSRLSTNPSGQEPFYGWSPNARSPRLAYRAFEVVGAIGSQLFVASPQGTGKKQVSGATNVQSGLSWDPTGRWLAYWGRNQSASFATFSVGVDEDVPTELLPSAFLTIRWSSIQSPVLPGGSSLAKLASGPSPTR